MLERILGTLAVAAITGVPLAVSAQPGAPTQPTPPGPPTATPTPPQPPRVPEPPAFPEGIIDDANSGRTWLSPTALTPPKGTWSFANHELFVVGLSYAPTNTIDMAVKTLIPIASDQPLVGFLSGKLQILKSRRLYVAATASLNYIGNFDDDDDDENDDDAAIVGTLGAAATYCFSRRCRSYVNGWLAAGFSSQTNNSSVPFVFTGAIVAGLSKRFKFVFELDTAFIAGDTNEIGDGALFWYGARFTSRSLAVDFGLAKLLCDDCDTDEALPLGLPWVNFTYRGLPGDS